MKINFTLLRFLLLALLLPMTGIFVRAQQANQPAYYRLNMLLSVTVGTTALHYGQATFNFADPTAGMANVSFGTSQNSTNVLPPQQVGTFLPNTDYQFTVTLTPATSSQLSLNLLSSNIGRVFINNVLQSGPMVFNNPGTTTITTATYTLRIALPNNYSVDPEPVYLPAGASTSMVSDKPILYFGLGRMRNGNPAGVVGFRAADFSASTFFTPAALYYSSYYPNPAGEVTPVYNSGTTTLRQILSREVLVNITGGASTYTLDFYQVGSSPPVLSGGLYPLSGSPFVSYTISQNTANGVKVTRAEDGITWETDLVLTGTATTGTWVCNDWHTQGTALNSNTTTVYSSNTAASVTQNGPASGLPGDTAFTWSKTFTSYTWGYEVAEKKLGAAETTPLTSDYSYYTTSSSSTGAVQGLLQWNTNQDGTWAAYTYYVGDPSSTSPTQNGLIQRVYHPWLDTPATAATASTANSAYDDYTYTYVAKGASGGVGATASLYLPSTMTTTLPDGTRLKQSVWNYNTRDSSLNGRYVWSSTQSDFSDASHSLATTSKFYVPNTTPDLLDDQPVSVTYPSGRKDSYAYFFGTWNSGTATFTASAGGNDRLVLCFHGQSSGGTAVPSWTNNAVTWSMDSVGMVGNYSTVSETVIDSNGRSAFTAENVYTATGTLERLSGVLSVYDTHARLTNLVDMMRSVGSHLYQTQRTYSAALLSSETAPDGVVTSYGYDDLLRQISKTTGVGGGTLYPAKVQTTTFDGANRPVAAYSCSCGTSPTLYTYDTAGRVIQKSEPSSNAGSPLLTNYTYSSVTSTTIMMPTGATTISATYADGHPKSITGTAQAPVSYTYADNATGLFVTKQNGSDLTNGWTTDQYDLVGRVVSHGTPTYGWTTSNNKIVDLASNYDPTTGLLNSQTLTYRATGGVLAPNHLFYYDGSGRLTDDGLDLDSSGSLVAASNDRFKHYDNSFLKDTNGWTNVAVTSTYATTSPTPPLISLSKVVTRFTGFNAGAWDTTYGLVASDVASTDVNNQTTAQLDYVLASALQHHTTVTVPGASNVGWAETNNGYSSESVAVSGLRTKSEYDSLGRLATVRSRWNGTAYAVADTNTYYFNTKLLNTQTVNGVTNTFTYSWGATPGTRQVTATDAGNNASYTLYNAMDLPFHVGGAAASPAQFTYDALGRRIGMTTWRTGNFTEANWPASGGDSTTWTIEAATGLVTSKIAADNSHVDYTYSALGQPLVRKNARGITTTYGYFDGSSGVNTDVSYRTQELSSITYSDSTPSVYFTYNRTGLPNVINDGTSIGSYTSATIGANAGHTFGYDTQPFRVLTETLSSFYNNRVETQQYDGVYRPDGFKLGTTGTPGADLSQTFGYQAASGLPSTLITSPVNQTSRTYTFNWVANTELFGGYTTPVSGGSYALAYTYQPSTNLRAEVKSSFTSSTLAQYDLTYNTLGQIQSVLQAGTAFADYYPSTGYSAVKNAFAYDGMGQLQTADLYTGNVAANELPGHRFEYRYDSMGNRTTAGETGLDVAHGGTDDSYSVNNLNQYSPSKTNYTVRVVGTVGTNAAITVAVSGATAAKTDRSWAADVVPAQGASSGTGTVGAYAAIPGNPDLLRTDFSKSYVIPPTPQPFTYDLDGNLTADGVWNYSYDAENRLTGMSSLLPAGGGFTHWTLAFTYDYLGRRVQKVATNADTPALNYTRRYVYNGWNLVAELDASGVTLKRSYTWGLDLAGSFGATGGVGALMQITDHVANKNYFAGYDHNGNVATLERDDGTLAAAYEYGPFGEPMRGDVFDAVVTDNAFRFSTKFTDAESGLAYYGHRFYSPTLGRFINKDPAEEQGGINLYGFCGNNAVSDVDWLGFLLVPRMVCTSVTTSGSFYTSWPTTCYIVYDDVSPNDWMRIGNTDPGNTGHPGATTTTTSTTTTPAAPKKTKNAPLDWLKKLCGSEAGRQLVSDLNAGKYNVFDVDWQINGLSEYTSGNNTYLTSGFGDGPSGGNDIFLFSVNASAITSAIANNRRFNYSGSVTDLQVSTLVHETLHFTNPTASEAQVWYLTDQNLGRYNLPVLFGLPNAKAYGGLVNPAHGYNGVQASTQSGSSNISISKNDLNDLKNQAAQYGGWDCSRVK